MLQFSGFCSSEIFTGDSEVGFVTLLLKEATASILKSCGVTHSFAKFGERNYRDVRLFFVVAVLWVFVCFCFLYQG